MTQEIEDREDIEETVEDLDDFDPLTGNEEADKRIRGALRKMHEATQERAKLEGELNAIKAQLQSKNEPPPEKKETFEDIVSEEDLEKLRDDPAHVKSILARVDSSLRKEFGAALRAIYEDLSGKVQSSDPELIRYKSEIEELRKNAAFAQLSTQQLVEIAKVKGGRTPRAPSAPTGGRTAQADGTSPTDKAAIEKDPVLSAAYQQMFGDAIRRAKESKEKATR